MILPRTIINERKGHLTINIYDDLAPNLWNMYEQGSMNPATGVAKLDLKNADLIQNTERQRIAKQIFDMTLTVLEELSREGKNIKKEWDEKYGNVPPKGHEGHEQLIAYSIGALFYSKVLTPYEYDMTEPAFDESGHLMYIKLLPKMKTDEITETIGSLIGTSEEKK